MATGLRRFFRKQMETKLLKELFTFQDDFWKCSAYWMIQAQRKAAPTSQMELLTCCCTNAFMRLDESTIYCTSVLRAVIFENKHRLCPTAHLHGMFLHIMEKKMFRNYQFQEMTTHYWHKNKLPQISLSFVMCSFDFSDVLFFFLASSLMFCIYLLKHFLTTLVYFTRFIG